MGLLTPWFLAGLAALAVPIIVHLMHRERRDVVVFPSLMFLRKIPYHSLRRQKLRHLLLLALRVLALVLVIAAFARPFLARRGPAAGLATPSSREVVILLDRSYSMGYGDRWEQAKSAARKTVDGLAGKDRATLVLFSENATPVTQSTSEPGVLRGAIASARLGAGVTRYAPAIRVAQGILEKSELPRRSVVLISDFQKSAWSARDVAKLPEGTTLQIVDLSDQETANVSIVSASLRRDHAEGRERVVVAARVANRSASAVNKLSATLELNGRGAETRQLSLTPGGSATVTFAAVAIPEGGARGTIHLGADRLPQDDEFHFVANRGRTLRLLIVEPDDAPATTSLYLRRALAIGDQPSMQVEVRKASRLATQDLDGRSLIILNNVPYPAAEAGRRLAQLVREGTGLLVVLGERSAPQRWSTSATTLMGVTAGAPADRSGERGGTLASIDRTHPAFVPFAAPRSGDFSAARFYRYRPLIPADSTAVLARFDDGSVALTDRRVGTGHVLVWGSTLDNFWNDLALQPVFLPFVHQLVRYAAGWVEERPWRTVGETITAAPQSRRAVIESDEAGAAWLVIAPSGTRRRLTAGDARAIDLDEQGIYELRRLGEESGRARWIAVNLDPREGDLTPLDPEELALAVVAPHAEAKTRAAAADETREEREARQRLWWFLLAAALLCLAAETMLSNRLSSAAR